MKLKLTNELTEKISQRKVKAIDLIAFVLNTIPTATTEKPIENTALKDIFIVNVINNQYIKNASIDGWSNELILEF
jgi:ABC-type antimicrobial peptide transport system permease subunit